MTLAMAAMQMVTRLRDHVERLDDGIAYAADDLAVVLRALLCPGNGNQVLRRLYDSHQLVIPEIRISLPAEEETSVFFSVGAIPTLEQAATADGAARVTLSKWMAEPVLVVTSSGLRVTYTWSKFLNSYANKWGGAHLDPGVPPHLQTIDHQAASGMPLSHYLLRSAGVQTWSLGQHLFRQVLRDYEPAGWSPEALAERRRAWADHPDGAICVAAGGNSTEPRDISPKGLLQHFTHRNASANFLWYVDESSPNNALHLALGTVPYDVRYEPPDVPATEGPVEISAQRHVQRPREIALEGTKSIPLDGQVRFLGQMRGMAL